MGKLCSALACCELDRKGIDLALDHSCRRIIRAVDYRSLGELSLPPRGAVVENFHETLASADYLPHAFCSGRVRTMVDTASTDIAIRSL